MNQPKEPGLRVKIYQLIKEKRGQNVHSGDIERFGQLNGYKAETAAHRARELVEEFITKKGVKKPNSCYCPDIKSFQLYGSTVYWCEESQKQNPVSNRRCTYCSKDATAYNKQNEAVCPTHSQVKAEPATLFS